MIEKVENIKRPLRVGEILLVPCFVREAENRLYITPVINHPHTDKENGQPETHYHTDYRFVKHRHDGIQAHVINKHSRHHFVESSRPQPGDHYKLEYIALPVISNEFIDTTPVELISKSKLKHRCIKDGLCPHRGYDLSQVQEKGGVIKCPLHGLRFNAHTLQVVGFKK